MKKDIVTAIKNKCLDCCCGQILEVRECTSVKCPLHPFRLGKDPYKIKKELTDEQREAYAERMRNYWKNKKEK